MVAKLSEYVNRGQFPVWVDCFMGRCFYSDIAPALRTRSINDNNDFIIEIYDGQEADDPAPKSGGVFHEQ